MVYAYDQWAQMPVKDLYDTQIMLAAVNAAKDMYEKGEQAIKDFRKDYGDFMSPFAYDTKWYNENFNVANKLGEIYSRGGDPLRNQADRAEIYRWINSRPYADYNNKKLRAANYQTYRQNMAKLEAAGKYDPDQEAYALMRRYGRSDDPSNWNLDEMGITNWDRLSPVQAVSLKDATQDWFDKRTPYTLSPDQVRQAGINYDPRYEYTGWLESDLQRTAGENVPGWNGSFAAEYFRDKARRDLAAAGISNPTEDQINSRLQNMVAEANREYIINPVRKADDYAKMATEFSYQRRLKAQEHADKMAEIAEAGKYKGDGGGENNVSGSYANVVNNAASAAYQAVLENTMTPKQAKELVRIQSIEDPQQKQAAYDKLQNRVFTTWLTKKRDGGSIFKRLLNVKAGKEGRDELNRILDSRAIGGSLNLDAEQILGSNLESAGDGWYDVRNSGYRVLSAHQLMSSILQGEGKGGFNVSMTDGKKYTQQDLINVLSKENEHTMSPNVWWSTEKNIAEGAEKIKPSTKTKRYLVAHDETGARKLYMKVKVNYDVPAWPFNSEADDMWVELPIEQLPIGTPSLESAPFFYGSELSERKAYTNAAVNQTYSDVRW